MEHENILDVLVQSIINAEQLPKVTGSDKKASVMAVVKSLMDPEEFDLYSGWISKTIDLLVEVGKNRKQLKLAAKKLFPCC